MPTYIHTTFLDGYSSTVQGLLDWFEIDLGFTELSFIQIGLCVLYVFPLYSRVSLSPYPFVDILHCLPRAVGVPLESALNLVSRMSPCGAHDTHACYDGSNDHLLFVMIGLMIQVFIEVRITYTHTHMHTCT